MSLTTELAERSKDKLTNSGSVSMQIIDFFIGSNIPYLCVTFKCADSYQITLSNNTLTTSIVCQVLHETFFV